MGQVETPAKNVFRKLCKKTILINSNDGNGALRTEREQRHGPTLVRKSPVSLKKKVHKKAAGV